MLPNPCLFPVLNLRVPVLVPVPLCHCPEHVPELLHLRRQLPDLVLLQDGQGQELPSGQDVGEAAVGYLKMKDISMIQWGNGWSF